tara:strand:- start:86 stop:370 length:285 start_codon:yes stop_codon:yes gene_type:complete
MLTNTDKKYGDLDCIIYEFSETGEEIPTHSHIEKETHITIVLKGSVEVYSDTWSINVDAGGIVDFIPFQKHAIRATQPNTKVISIKKYFNTDGE